MFIEKKLKSITYLSSIYRLALEKKVKVWLVGGFLRDCYLKELKIVGQDRDLVDFDFCVEKNTLSFVKEFSKRISSKFIVLDKKQQSYRVIVKLKNKIHTYDFTALRAKSLYQDLMLRDFSINTLAVEVNKPEQTIIDLLGSLNSIKTKKIQVVAENVLKDDPLRILRAFSFMANLDFVIEPKTLKFLAKYRKFLKHVSAERINEELFKILGAPNCLKAIELMDKLRILEEVIPYIDKTRGVTQGSYHHLDVWRHSLEALRQLETLDEKIFQKNKDISNYLNEELAVNRRRKQVIKLACLLHDIGKPEAKAKKGKKTIFYMHEKIGRDLAQNIANSLKMSFREKEVLKKLIFWHLRPGYLADLETPSKRAVYRFFNDTQEEGAAVILLSLADWRATRGRLTNLAKRKKHEKIMLRLVDKYFFDKKKKPIIKLIDGYDIMREFNLKPSEIIGKLLQKVKEEQALGRINNKPQAFELIKKIIKRQKIDEQS